MTEEQIKQKFKETYPDFMRGDEPLSPYFDIWEYAIEIATKELQEEVKYHRFQRCRECEGLHKGNGNCTIIGGYYTAVPDTHCPKIKEKLELAKENKELQEIIRELIKNRPDTYSGTDIELQQKKMFAFQNAVNKAEAFINKE